MRRTNLVLISGSLRSGSTNSAVVRTLAERQAGADADPTYTAEPYQGMADLPHFNPDDDEEPPHPEVARLRGTIQAADALLFCIPEYAGDLPGSFKNLLDWTVGGTEIVDKPVGWVNVSSSPTGAAGAHQALRTVLGYTGGRIVEAACVHVPVPRSVVDPDTGLLTDASTRDAVGTVARTLADHVAAAD